MQTMRSYVIQEIVRLAEKHPIFKASFTVNGQEVSPKGFKEDNFYRLLTYYEIGVRIDQTGEVRKREAEIAEYLARKVFSLP